MEFGEKIRRAREAKGMTQQTLAEQLYVTRQAVSRWENGARYPDLLTAKKLADRLDTSLDELLSGEEKAVQTQCAPVLDQRAGAVQTALLAFACLAEVVLALMALSGLVTIGAGAAINTYFTAVFVGRVLRAALCGVGLWWSIRGRLTPRYIGLCAVGCCGPTLLAWIAYIQLYPTDLSPRALMIPALQLVFCALMFRHFFLAQRESPWVVWLPAGGIGLLRVGTFVESLYTISTAPAGVNLMASFAKLSLALAAEVSFLILLAYQAKILARKRMQ